MTTGRAARVLLLGAVMGLVPVAVHAASSGQELTYEHWITTLNGYSYQLIFWTSPENATRQAQEAKRMLDSFHILDPDRKATRLPSGASR